MQEQQPHRQFGKETATFIVELVNNQSGGYEFLEFRDDGHTPGVYVSETYIGLFPSGVEGIEAGNVFEWNPACDTEDDADPEASPLLPVPFTAKELAALLLYGVGDYIQERLGPIGQLDEDQLSRLGGVRKKLPRQALRAAYDEAERAQQIVGLPDIEAQELAYSLSEQLDEAEREENHRQGVFARDISPEEASRRRALVVESLADLRKRTQVAKSEAAAKTARWRSAMVRQLLAPLPQTPALPIAPTPEQPARDDAGPVLEDAYQAEAGVSTDGLVMWQAVMLEHWLMIAEASGGKPTARKAMQWLKRHGSRDVFPEQQPDHNALAWLDLAGNPQTASLKTIQNQISRWKAGGNIPV